MRRLNWGGLSFGLFGLVLLATSGSAPVAAEGSILERSRLTGDWGGVRTSLEDRGISVKATWTYFLESVVTGDNPTGPLSGGHVDAVLTFDGTRANFIKGFAIDVALEGHYGRTINSHAGTVIPPNFAMSVIEAGDSVWGMTRFRATQQLGNGVSVYVGKFTPLYGFQNEFMDGRGLTKFEHTAFVAKPAVAGSIAYTAWMAGINWNIIPSSGPRDRGTWLKYLVQDSNLTATRWGLDTLFDNGVNMLAEVDFPTNFFGLPGNHVINVTWSSRKRTSLDINEAVILPGGGIAPGVLDRTWSLFYSFDQYLYVDPIDPKRGWGLFGKVEFSDANPNPVALALAFGLGGTGPFDSRPSDKWGIGGFVVDLSGTLENSLAGIVDLTGERGYEAFYSFALTPSTSLSIDGQVLRPADKARDWQSVLGLRLNVNL
ncbi:MAG: carbohydrate porin [Hyphomicrobiaceae bacterium]